MSEKLVTVKSYKIVVDQNESAKMVETGQSRDFYVDDKGFYRPVGGYLPQPNQKK